MTVTIDLGVLLTGAGIIIFGAAVFGIGVLLFKKISRFIASRKFLNADRTTMRRRWLEVEELLQSEGSMSDKMAVLEADKLLDHALKSLAMPGESLGERLKFAAYKYPKIKKVWWAHKIRNQLVHEATFRLDQGVARKAVKTFKRALEMIGAI